MFEADSNIQTLEYDGIDAQIRSKMNVAKYKSTAFQGYDSVDVDDTVIIDAKGNGLDEDLCEEACLRAVNNMGMPMDMYLSTNIHSNFSRAFYAKERTRPGDKTAAGYMVPEFNGTLNFKIKSSLFNRPRISPITVAVSVTAAPTMANFLSPADAASKFASTDAGTYSYKVSSVYADGETVATAASGTAVAAGDKVTVEISYTGSPLYFNVFRAPVGTTSGHEYIGRVKPLGSAAVHSIDYNARLPGTARAYLLMHDPDVLSWRQLGSLIKYDLAVTDTSYSWLQLLYGGIIVQAPRKNVIIENLKAPVRS